MSAKSKSALSGTPHSKPSPATPRVSKSSRGVAKPGTDSTSLQNGRLSVDPSPRSVTSKPKVDRPSPKLSATPDKKAASILKPSELQAELSVTQEDLKRATEKLVLVEKEKAKALDESKEAQRLSEEANEKIREALVAQKRAEENSEIEKFRAVEMEQVSIEAAQRKEEEWQKEVEAVRNEHAVDVAALLSATQELQKVKQELALACDAKNRALSHADDAMKIAETHAEKIEALSAELVHLKAELDSKVEMVANANQKLVSKLELEVVSLRQQLEKVRVFEDKLAEKEATLEQLNVDLEAAKMAECYAHNLLEELHERAEELTSQAEQARRMEKSASDSVELVMKQLEGSNDSLHDAESEIAILREKAGLLEISSERQKRDLDESERRLERAKEEVSDMVKKVEFLESELETVQEERTQALNNERLAAASVRTLLEEKNELIKELGTSRNEEEKFKKALESAASALHEVSSEARDAKEKLFSVQVEHENYEKQIEDQRLVLKATNEKYESMLDDAKQEIDALSSSIEQSKQDYNNLKADLEQKELHLMNSVKKSEEENSCMENEISRLANLLKLAEEEASATRKEGDSWKNSCNEANSEAIHLKAVLGEAKTESIRLKEGLIDRENELQNIRLENKELQKREADSLKKIEELGKLLLEEALAKKQGEENGELTDSEKDYDVLPKVVEFSEQNGNGDAEVNDIFNDQSAERGKVKEGEEKEEENADFAQVDIKMWESCKIDEKDLSSEGEREQESFEDELESKTDGGGDVNIENGGDFLSKSQGEKKKKALLSKFGSLLKKKGSSYQK